MRKGKGLKKLFNKVTASAVLSFSFLTGVAVDAADAQDAVPHSLQLPVQQPAGVAAPPPVFVSPPPVSASPPTVLATQAAVVPASPDTSLPPAQPSAVVLFKSPLQPPPDPALMARQQQLKTLGIDPGDGDGRMGNDTRSAVSEFLLFYGPLYGGAAGRAELTDADALKLKTYADMAATDAAAPAPAGSKVTLTTAKAAALRLAAGRTGVSYDKLAAAARGGGHLDGVRDKGASRSDLFKFDNPTWLYLVKTHGAKYGLGLYADHITLATGADGVVTPSVENPFLHSQLLDLKSQPRLSALLGAEYLAHPGRMPAIAKPLSPAFDAAVKAQQSDLADVGFDLGSLQADGRKGDLTAIAVGEYQLLYGEGIATGALSPEEAGSLNTAAVRARAEAQKYWVPTAAVGAIHMASDKNTIDFPYMMELAEAESSFVHSARAQNTSATGLYQFVESTWSDLLRQDGAKYGLGAFTGQVEIYQDDFGRDQARVSSPLLRAEALELRKNSQLSALFSARFQQENRLEESSHAAGPLSRTDLYLAHFLGASGAVNFIDQMQAAPGRSAAAVFPDAAASNVDTFYDTKDGVPVRERTLKEVYDRLGRKFNRGTYDDPAVSDPLLVATKLPPRFDPPGKAA